jgi:hypothetical protein
MEEVLDVLSHGWTGPLLGLFGILTGIIGIFANKIIKSKAEPVYQATALNLIGKEDSNLPNQVSVLYNDQKVERLTKTTIVLWNKGSEVLKGEDLVIDRPLCFQFDEDDNILSCEIIKRTKDVNKFSVHIDKNKPQQVIASFDYFDPDDGVVIEILHDSQKEYPNLSGAIKGIPKGVIDLGKFQPVRDMNTLKGLERAIYIMDNKRVFHYIAIILGLVIVAMGLLPEETIESIRLAMREDKSSIDSSVLVLVGLVYAALPISLLWAKRKRYPRLLEMDGHVSSENSAK